MRRATLVLCASVTATGLMASVIPASAAAGLPLTRGGMISASLRVSDIPKAFGQNLTAAISYTATPSTRPFEMCVDKNGRKVFGVRPLQHANSSVPLSQRGSGSNITSSVSVSSDIYGYASARVADARWASLLRATARCAPTVRTAVPAQGVSVGVLVRQQRICLGPSTRGDVGRACASSFAIAQQVAVRAGSGAPSDVKIYVGGYSVYRKSGTTILRVQFANYKSQPPAASSRIRPAWAQFTRTEALRISHRVAQLPVS